MKSECFKQLYVLSCHVFQNFTIKGFLNFDSSFLQIYVQKRTQTKFIDFKVIYRLNADIYNVLKMVSLFNIPTYLGLEINKVAYEQITYAVAVKIAIHQIETKLKLNISYINNIKGSV